VIVTFFSSGKLRLSVETDAVLLDAEAFPHPMSVPADIARTSAVAINFFVVFFIFLSFS
jgi:hypothetical protein